MTEQVNWIDRAGKKAKGKRPAYLEDPATERTLSIVMALAGEISVVRERMDTIERLLEEKGSITQADIEAYAPDKEAAYERGVMTKSYIARIMRGVQQDMEALDEINDPTVEELSTTLREM